jgi:hypothetical protein
MLRTLVKRALSALPDRIQGGLEYWFRPSLASGFGVLNGQRIRQSIFHRILTGIAIGQIIETGTFRGTTTEYFAKTGIPIHSIEVSGKFWQYSKLRLRSVDNVTLYHGSSVSQLPEICRRLASQKSPTFVYLDAHWDDYLPLREEIEILSELLPRSVIMIDDFEVPEDGGYRFDDYGDGNRISLEYLREAKIFSPLFTYFPALSANEETGEKRGMCVATFTPEINSQLGRIEQLRYHSVRFPAQYASKLTQFQKSNRK